MDSKGELNIPSTHPDPSYRYKMPRIQAVTQGSGGGVKTKWANITEVSNALKVPIEYPLKFIGKELGSNTEIKNNNYLINGSHTVDKLQEVLDKFIKKYVLCPKCKLPEIYNKIFIKKDKGEIRCKCRACGTISKLDSTHEFSTYIKRSPPPFDEDSKEGDGEKSAPSEKPKEEKKLLDEKTQNLIKATIQKITKSLTNNIEDNIKGTTTILGENSFNLDVKYYILANALFDKNMYTQQLLQRIPILKSFITADKEKTDEALFYFILGFSDLIFLRLKGECAKYISSLLYYFYQEDVITEEFWKNYAVTLKLPKFNTPFYTKEGEEKFLKAANEFTAWIENGPYEGDDEETSKTQTIGDMKGTNVDLNSGITDKPVKESSNEKAIDSEGIDIDNI